MDEPTEEEKRKPFLYRHFVKIPEAGKFVFMDSGWMSEVTSQKLSGELSEEEYKKRIESIKDLNDSLRIMDISCLSSSLILIRRSRRSD